MKRKIAHLMADALMVDIFKATKSPASRIILVNRLGFIERIIATRNSILTVVIMRSKHDNVVASKAAINRDEFRAFELLTD